MLVCGVEGEEDGKSMIDVGNTVGEVCGVSSEKILKGLSAKLKEKRMKNQCMWCACG